MGNQNWKVVGMKLAWHRVQQTADGGKGNALLHVQMWPSLVLLPET
jgi:hypothetical protein